MNRKVSRCIVLNNKKIEYILEFKNVKNINIHVHPLKGLYVSAPHFTDISYIEQCLKKDSRGIIKALEKCEHIDNDSNTKQFEQSLNNSKHTITLNNKTVEYSIQLKNIKRLNLSVSPEKGVRVSAPYYTPFKFIEDFIKNNAEFILNSLEKFEKEAKKLPKPKQFIDGEYFFYLGEKMQLTVKTSDYNAVKLKDNIIELHVTDANDFSLKEFVMNEFLKQACTEYVNKMCRLLYPIFKKKGIDFPNEIRYRKMVSCWGVCRPQRGILTFNTYLIQLPPKSIEAVICHEFTHYLYPNHSKDFYAQLTEFMPDWKIHDKIMRDLQQEIIIRDYSR